MEVDGHNMVKPSKKRADLRLVECGLAESRERAQALIMKGVVYTPHGKVLKPGSLLPADEMLEVKGRLPYVSRGGIKLAHALERFGLEVTGRTALDVGASTGGFTDCLLQKGAKGVVALDVGHGQLDYRVRHDPRVRVMEGLNARYTFSLSPAEGEQEVDLATVDVAFISITKVVPTVAQHVKPGGFMVVLVKPQFEAKRAEVGRGGVIRDPRTHALVLGRVVHWVVESGLRLRNLTASPIVGDAGNREFFILLEK